MQRACHFEASQHLRRVLSGAARLIQAARRYPAPLGLSLRVMDIVR